MPGTSRFFRPIFHSLFLVAVLVLFPASHAAGEHDENSTVLRMGSWRTDDIVQMNQLLDEFHADHPAIRILFDPTPAAEYDEVLETQLRFETAPDLFYLRSFSTSRKLYEAGRIAPLNDLPALREQFNPDYLRPWQAADGTIYGLPFVAVAHGIYYNQDIFQELNLSIPQTWEQLLTTAKNLQIAGFIPFANASGDAWTINEIVMMNIMPGFIGGQSGRLAYVNGERCFNDQGMVDAFQALADLGPYFPENHHLLKYSDSLGLFLEGRAAMWLGGSWDIAYFNTQQPGFAWDIFATPAPTGNDPVMVFHPDTAIGLNAASRQQEAAKIFLSWLALPETGKRVAEVLPGLFPMHAAKPDLNNPPAQSFLRLVQAMDNDIRFVWDKLRDGEPDGYHLLQDLSMDVLAGDKTAKQAADALQTGLAQWFAPARECPQ